MKRLLSSAAMLLVCCAYFQKFVSPHVQQVPHFLTACVIFAGLPDEFRPVSYTHLDVYKRQAVLR